MLYPVLRSVPGDYRNKKFGLQGSNFRFLFRTQLIFDRDYFGIKIRTLQYILDNARDLW